MTTNTAPTETHEPDFPTNWPHGHVAVDRAERDGAAPDLLTSNVAVTITDDTEDECLALDMGETRHFLHSSTARELSNMLLALNGQPVRITVHGVEHRAGGAAARALNKELMTKIKEWNRTAVAAGMPPV
ncbi:hypothetical protein [Arthrobacter sp. ES1]|uniref:hypothetical protein n=1 Tax=Arthrobacter sp. ES1 TaxID=1897056 RepID=UPI001CFFFE24|nr:hypothetical protein [Arthrobacter sp. ES1]MCB5280551.1 hypothetical protein [Arthrobacter sp. ES1]